MFHCKAVLLKYDGCIVCICEIHPRNSTTCGSREMKLAIQFWRLKKYGYGNHIAPLLNIFSEYIVNFVIFNLRLTFSLSLAGAYRCLGQTIGQERISSSFSYFNSRTCLCCKRSGVWSKGELLKWLLDFLHLSGDDENLHFMVIYSALSRVLKGHVLFFNAAIERTREEGGFYRSEVASIEWSADACWKRLPGCRRASRKAMV